MLAYRVVPWRPTERSIEALLPARQGMGRFDDPKRYRMLYLAESPDAAVGEAMHRFREWEPHLADRTLVEVSVPAVGLANLDDHAELHRQAIDPSRVVWPEREVTQAIARRLHAQREFIGLRWWSRLHSPWALLGLWSPNRARIAGDPQPLSNDHPAVLAAARTLRVEI